MTYISAFCFVISFNSHYSGLSKDVHNFFLSQVAEKWGVIKNGPIYMENPVNKVSCLKKKSQNDFYVRMFLIKKGKS